MGYPHGANKKKGADMFHRLKSQQPTGFPKKDASFSKLKNNPDLLSDEKDGKIKIST